MDGAQFDRLARVIGGAPSRRGVLKTLAGGALGALVAAAGLGNAAAKTSARCRLLDAPCGQNHDCCSKHCCDGACCAPSSACPVGWRHCGKGPCVDLQTDVRNCGACGQACPAGRTCVGGVCGCPAGTEVCGGVCVDTRAFDFDPANCGACGYVCPAGQFCSEGLCGICRQLGDDCGADANCCSGLCNQGSCDLCPADPSCPAGQVRAAGCGCGCACPSTDCACAAGTGCSGDATSCTHTTVGVCCPWPQRAFACQDSAPGVIDGFALCCTPEAGDCPPCPSGNVAIGGRTNNCAPPPNRGGSVIGLCFPAGSGSRVEGADSVCR